MYKITTYSKQQAKKLGVEIRPSENKNKKIDVYKGDKRVASIGSKNYKDYPTYINEKGLAYANERRQLYKVRHDNDRKVKGSNGWYADRILW